MQQNHTGNWSMGGNTFTVPSSMFGKHRAKLIERMSKLAPNGNGIVLLEGGHQQEQYDTDREMLFRQESYFMYLFGVVEPDCFGTVDLSDGSATLFIPHLPDSYAVWEGVIRTPEYFKEKYGVAQVRYVEDLKKFMHERKPEVIYTLYGRNSDSGHFSTPAAFEGIEEFKVDQQVLHHELTECRVIKTPEELNLMRYVNKIASDAHNRVMEECVPGMYEYQLESLFLHHTYSEGGCRFTAYTCICGTGKSGATLHYGTNNKLVKEGDIILLDMGAEYHGYVSDITRSYPANGKFNQDQRDIYESVLAAQNAVMSQMKAGVSWPSMHRLAEKVMLEQLLARGFLKGTLEELVAKNIGSVFMPHGLGHLMGLDTHDVGGYTHGRERSKELGLNKLRSDRILEEGMVVTVEPGIYFVEATIRPALANPELAHLFNHEKIEKFMNFGGIRIEDDVIVLKDGIENMTLSPRDIAGIEAIMENGRRKREKKI